jgi:hypothetical protein
MEGFHSVFHAVMLRRPSEAWLLAELNDTNFHQNEAINVSVYVTNCWGVGTLLSVLLFILARIHKREKKVQQPQKFSSGYLISPTIST